MDYRTSGNYDTQTTAKSEGPSDTPPVHRQMEMLEKRLASISDTTARLRERLGTVMSPVVAGSLDGQNAPQPELSPLANHLRHLEKTAAECEGNLRLLLAGLEI